MKETMAASDTVDSSVVQLLQEARKFVRPPKERTLFSLGGRSYYENPASDVLAFLLTPDAEHGFHSVFLEAFLTCINADCNDLSFADVTVSRETQTKEGNRIDLVIDGPNWVLLIENKIYHGQNNPFASYEEFGRSLAGTKKLFKAILSPGGKSVDPSWKPISYQNYCNVIRQRLSDALFNLPYSKWVIFAREFILHLENELYQPTMIMTDAEADFVEQNTAAIAQVKKLSSDYRKFLLDTLRDRLLASGDGQNFTTKDDGWAVRCYSETWGRSNLAFSSASLDAAGKRFKITVYLIGLDEARQREADEALRGMKHWREKDWFAWQTQMGFDRREDAINELCRLACVISKLFPAKPEPTQPEANSLGSP